MNRSVKCGPIYGNHQSIKQLLQRIEISFYGSSSEAIDADFQAALRNSLRYIERGRIVSLTFNILGVT